MSMSDETMYQHLDEYGLLPPRSVSSTRQTTTPETVFTMILLLRYIRLTRMHRGFNWRRNGRRNDITKYLYGPH